MDAPLLATKLYVPPPRAGVLSRPRLIACLNAAVGRGDLQRGPVVVRKLTLVSAPAGFGKTTLLSAWIQLLESGARQPQAGGRSAAPVQVAWLSLDDGDNDPALFLRYLTAALQRLDEGLGRGTDSLLQAPQLPATPRWVTGLLNDVAALPGLIIVVLDDYQAIRRAEIHDMLGYLIEHQPPRMHTVVATRRDPPLPLARWRARGELLELRVPELRFSPEEARDFLKESMGLDLAADLVASLAARTEGWIAGLQLAALAVQGVEAGGGGRDLAGFVRQFSGSDRYLLDYLLDEVLAQQPAHLRRFLQQTAILDELSAPLCDYVRFGQARPGGKSLVPAAEPGGSGSTKGPEASAALLHEVERAGLFLIPLDNRREWYRYHSLFAEALLAAAGEAEAAELHRRAATWYEAQGRVPDAIRHALAAGDREAAVRLIRSAAPEQMQHGAFVRVLSWLERLPDEAVRSDPDLATFKGYSLLWTGEVEAARSYSDAAAASLARDAPAETRGRVLTLQAHLCGERGPSVIPLVAEAIELLPEATPFFYGAALLLLALCYKASGRVPELMESLDRLARVERTRSPFLAATAMGEMADVLRLQGKRGAALDLCQRAVETHVDSQGQPLPGLIVVELIAAILAYEAGELDDALRRAEEGARRAEQMGLSFLAAQMKCYVAVPCHQAMGDGDAAWAALRRARALAAVDPPLYAEAPLDAGSCEAWLNLQEGNLPAAARWVDAFDLTPQDLRYDLSHVYVTRARVLLALGRLPAAAAALDWLEKWARVGGWGRVLLSVTILRAIAAQQDGDEELALDHLVAALHLAAAEGYRSAFLNQDPAILALLPRLYSRRREAVPAAFVESLLAALAQRQGGVVREAAPARAGAVRSSSQLVEPLSERELEVLRLVAGGLTNSEIGERLYISPGTAKWHTINIYRKLDVHSRVQAVSRARALGLL